MKFIKKLVARFAYYGTCPNCGRALMFSTSNGTTHCNGCNKTIVIRNGEPVGWK